MQRAEEEASSGPCPRKPCLHDSPSSWSKSCAAGPDHGLCRGDMFPPNPQTRCRGVSRREDGDRRVLCGMVEKHRPWTGPAAATAIRSKRRVDARGTTAGWIAANHLSRSGP